MAFVETPTGGYAIEHERPEAIVSGSTPLAYRADPSGLRMEIDNTKWIQIENQGSIGSCAGNAMSSCMEMQAVYQLSNVVQLSRFGCYRISQRFDGITGDRGSTIYGNCQAATEEGIPDEQRWPYPPKYYSEFPSDFESMPRWKVEGFAKLTTYEASHAHLSQFGPIHLGISWLKCMDKAAGKNAILDEFGGSGGGGHALCIGGCTLYDWSGHVLPGDQPYLIMINSWSKNWGNDGRLLISPRAWQQMLDHKNSEMVGLFNLVDPKAPQITAEPV